MDRFQQLQIFVAVAEGAGFSAASRRLGLSPPVVTRAVKALEERLGVQLLTRTTRTVRTTEAGMQFLEDAKQILEAMQDADEAVTGVNQSPSGRIAITAPAMFGARFVMPTIVEYLGQYPDTSLETLFVDRLVNLVDEGLDVGVRIGELSDSSLRQRRVGQISRVVVAAPSYLEKYGEPEKPEELKQHTLLASRAGDGAVSWHFAKDGFMRIEPRLWTNTNDAAVAAAVRGLGITQLLSYQVMDEIAAGDLIRLLPEHESQALPVQIVHREGRYGAARVRSFIDLLSENLQEALS